MSHISFIDIHSHLNDPRFDQDLPDALSRMRDVGVAAIVVGTDRAMSERAIALAEAHDDLWCTIGQHPTDKHEEVFDKTWYREQCAHPKVVGVGECGLDYYWPANPNSKKSFGDMETEKRRQHELFAYQIALAEELKKPLMIHGRPTPKSMDAYEDILALLRGKNVFGNIHFFVGNTAIAKQFLDIGFTLSFTGVLTFTHDYDEVVDYIPLDRIMAETDCPYVAPVPHRGGRNESSYLPFVIQKIADIRNEDEGRVRTQILQTSMNSWGIHGG